MKWIIVIIFVLLSSFVSAQEFCADGICSGSENPENCPEDCTLGVVDYVVCLADENMCVGENMRQMAVNGLVILLALIILIYLKIKRFI